MILRRWFRSARARRPAPSPTRPAAHHLSVECLEARDNPSGGLLDPTFGTGGTVPFNYVPSYARGWADVALLPDGKLLTAGYLGTSSTGADFAAGRYNPDGTPDATFGSSGLTSVDFNKSTDIARAVAVQPGTGGKILVAGTAGSGFGVVRLNPNGTLDTTFGGKGGKGEVTVSPGARGTVTLGYSMAVFPDGRFVVAGITKTDGSHVNGVISLAGFNANGTLDTTFGTSGTVLTTVAVKSGSRTGEHAVNVAVDGAGRLVVASTTATDASPTDRGDFLLTRFKPNGSLDTTFGTAGTGVVTTDLKSGGYGLDWAYALTLQADDKIVVAGVTCADTGDAPRPAVVRYNADGSLDAGFDGDGIASAYWPPSPSDRNQEIKAVAVQPDGKVLLAGWGGVPVTLADGTTTSQTAALLVRFNASGSLDTAYGPSGTGFAAAGLGGTMIPYAIALQSDGRAVVAGSLTTPSSPYQYSFALARFTAATATPSPVQVGSFAASSPTVAAGSPLTLTAGGITDANGGATVTKVAFYYFDASGTEQLLGYGTRKPDGTWALTFAVNLAPGTYTLLALAADSTGAVSDPLSLSLQVV